MTKINFIDTFFMDKLIQYQNGTKPEVISSVNELSKRVSLEEILNLNSGRSALPKLPERPKNKSRRRSKNKVISIEEANKENIWNTESKKSATYLKENPKIKRYSPNEQSSLEKNLNSTLRRSSRLRNKLNITAISSNPIYQPSVTISPMKDQLLKKKNSTKNSKLNKSKPTTVFNSNSSSSDIKQHKAAIINDMNKKNHMSNSPKKSMQIKKKDDENIMTQDITEQPFNSDIKTQNKKIAKIGTLKYLKDRQNFMKNLLTENNPTDYMEVCSRKKCQAFENLLKMNPNETLSIKTPKDKDKRKETYLGMTPRTALLNEWSNANPFPTDTPKDALKSREKIEKEKDALTLVYQHLKNKPSKRTKSNWSKLRESPVKLPRKTSKTKDDNWNALMDLDETEQQIFNCLSEKPSQDLNESSFDDYFNNESFKIV